MSGWDIERIPTAMNNTQDLLDYRLKMIENLQQNLEEAGTLCKKQNSEIVSLTEEKNKLVTRQYHLDYQVENQKKRIEDLGKTLSLYERENKAFRELIRLWI